MPEPQYDQQDADNYYLAVENRALRKERDELLQELRFIADARPSTWEPDVRDQFQQWAQNRARTAISRAEKTRTNTHP